MLRQWLKRHPSGDGTPPHLPSPDLARNGEDEELIIVGNCGAEQCASPATPGSSSKKRKRGNYNTYDGEQRAKMARHAVENGVMNAARKFQVSESTIRSLKKQFLEKQKVDGATPSEMARSSRGKPLMLGPLDDDIQRYVRYQRQGGNPISIPLLLGAARGIISNKNRQLLMENGGSVEITKSWAQSLLRRMGFVNRKGTKAARKTPADFDMLKMEFLAEIQKTVTTYAIPEDLVINFDQTGVNIVPVGNYTMEASGSKQVPIIGLEDKRQITVVLACTLSGKMLPPQVIYQGKTDLCHPKFNFPSDWHITHSENHWSNTDTMDQYVEHVLAPYVESVRESLPLSQSNQEALCVFDVFAAHRTESFQKALEAAGIKFRYIPASCTGELQPLDISGNQDFKRGLKNEFQKWYAGQIDAKLKEGVQIDSVKIDLKLNLLKPLHAGWMVSAIQGVNQGSIKTGWVKSGIEDVLTK